MALSEADLELLDSHLDNELSGDEQAALNRRLSGERELADALEQLRSERDARVKFFDALEPDNATVQRLTASVHRAVSKDVIWMKRARALRTVSGIAACLLVGFGGGYLFRGQPGTASITNTAGVNVTSPVATAGDGTSGNREIFFPANPGARIPSMPGGNQLAPGANSKLVGYDVSLTDEAGNVIGVQRFPTLDQARDFANEVNRWRKGHNQLQNGGVRVVGDQF